MPKRSDTGLLLTQRLVRTESLIAENKARETPGNYASGGILFGNSAGKAKADSTNFVWDNTNKRLGIGTNAPNVKVDIRGTDSSFAGPHINFTTSVDAYPEFQILPYTHNNINLTFDAHWNSTNWISSNVGSNYQIRKSGDALAFYVADAITAGSIIATWNEMLRFNIRGGHFITYYDGAQNTAPNGVTFGRRTSAALSGIVAGFGLQTTWLLDTTTTAQQNAAAEIVSWSDPTHATRNALRRHFIYDTAAREYFRAEASGTAALISWFGVAAVVRQTGGAATADLTYDATERDMINRMYTAMRNYGLLT